MNGPHPTSQIAFVLGRLLELDELRVAVELGSGSPDLTSLLAPSRRAGTAVHVLDSDVRRLRSSRGTGDLPASRVAGDVYGLPLREGAADLVIWRKLFCVLPDPAAALEAIRRIVRPGGQIVAVEPAGPQQFHAPDDDRFAELSRKLNRSFREGWRRQGADQDIGLRMPELFADAGLTRIATEGVVEVHLLSDHRRSRGDVLGQLQTEASRLPPETLRLLTSGGLDRSELEEHRERARERLRRFANTGADAGMGSYLRVMSPLIVSSGRRSGEG